MNHRAACSSAAFLQGNLLNGAPLCMYTNTYENQWGENTLRVTNYSSAVKWESQK